MLLRKFQLDPEQWTERHSVEVSLQIHNYSVFFIYLILYSKIQMDPVVTLKMFQAIEKQTLLSVHCSDHFIHNFLNLLEGKALSLRSCKNIRYLWLYSRGGLMVSALVSGSRGPGLSPDRGHCVVFLGKTLYSHSAPLHPGV